MPNKKSAIKRMRSDKVKHERNHATLSELETLYKKLLKEVEAKSDQSEVSFRKLVSKLDKAVVRGILPHGRADRKKARIATLLHKAKSSQAA